MAITQPGGAGTTIYLYDDSNNTNHAAAPGPHTWAEIAAAFAADFVSNGTNVPSYRARVSVQIGDTGVGSATTTLTDTDATVIFDNTRTLAFRATQTTSWFLNLGTKIGTGNQASGVRGGLVAFGGATTLRGTVKLYGAIIRQTSGAVIWSPSGNGVGEAINTLFQSSASGVAPFSFGTAATTELANMYNCDFSHTTANQMIANLNCQNLERITLGAAAPTALLATGAASISVKDAALFGTGSQSDLRWSSSSLGWKLIRPRFSGNAPKFSSSNSVSPDLAGATVEYWLWNTKVVDGTGAGILGIPVTLTDAFGNVVVNTTTDASGEISFGSGLLSNAVPVMDHYMDTVYVQRHRSPFTAEYNTGSGRNGNYPTRRVVFNWERYATITTTAGSFADMSDVVMLEEPYGNPTTWVELEL